MYITYISKIYEYVCIFKYTYIYIYIYTVRIHYVNTNFCLDVINPE